MINKAKPVSVQHRAYTIETEQKNLKKKSMKFKVRDKDLERTHSSKEPWSFSSLSSGELESAHTHLWKTYIMFLGILKVYWCHIGSLISAIVGIFKPQKNGIHDESEHCSSPPPQESVTKHLLIYHCTSFSIENSLLAIM